MLLLERMITEARLIQAMGVVLGNVESEHGPRMAALTRVLIAESEASIQHIVSRIKWLI